MVQPSRQCGLQGINILTLVSSLVVMKFSLRSKEMPFFLPMEIQLRDRIMAKHIEMKSWKTPKRFCLSPNLLYVSPHKKLAFCERTHCRKIAPIRRVAWICARNFHQTPHDHEAHSECFLLTCTRLLLEQDYFLHNWFRTSFFEKVCLKNPSRMTIMCWRKFSIETINGISKFT